MPYLVTFLPAIVISLINTTSLFSMFNCRLEARKTPCIDESNLVRSGHTLAPPPLIRRISTSFSCPNIKQHAIRRQIYKPPRISKPNHEFRESGTEETQHIPAWPGLSGKATSGKLSKLPSPPPAAQRTYYTNLGQNCSSRSMGPLQDAQHTSMCPVTFCLRI